MRERELRTQKAEAEERASEQNTPRLTSTLLLREPWKCGMNMRNKRAWARERLARSEHEITLRVTKAVQLCYPNRQAASP